MKKFEIFLTGIIYQEFTLEVEADSKEKAEKQARYDKRFIDPEYERFYLLNVYSKEIDV